MLLVQDWQRYAQETIEVCDQRAEWPEHSQGDPKLCNPKPTLWSFLSPLSRKYPSSAKDLSLLLFLRTLSKKHPIPLELKPFLHFDHFSWFTVRKASLSLRGRKFWVHTKDSTSIWWQSEFDIMLYRLRSRPLRASCKLWIDFPTFDLESSFSKSDLAVSVFAPESWISFATSTLHGFLSEATLSLACW